MAAAQNVQIKEASIGLGPVNPLMWVILSMSLPSACMVYTCHAPVRSLSKTISRPFGDQAAQNDWCFVDVWVS